MQKLFFSIIAIFLFTCTVSATTDYPLLIQKTGQTRVHAAIPKQFGTTKYHNAIAEKTEERTFLFVRNNTDQNETFIFFSEGNDGHWKYIGRVCSNLSDLKYQVTNNGWDLEVIEKDCQHKYEKKFSFPGEIYEEIK